RADRRSGRVARSAGVAADFAAAPHRIPRADYRPRLLHRLESEREEPNVMRRPPRPVGEPLFDRRMVVFSLLQGAGVLVVTVGVLARAVLMGLPEEDARVLTFATLVIGDLGLILANRAVSGTMLVALRTANTTLWLVVGSAAVLLGAVVAVP